MLCKSVCRLYVYVCVRVSHERQRSASEAGRRLRRQAASSAREAEGMWMPAQAKQRRRRRARKRERERFLTSGLQLLTRSPASLVWLLSRSRDSSREQRPQSPGLQSRDHCTRPPLLRSCCCCCCCRCGAASALFSFFGERILIPCILRHPSLALSSSLLHVQT